MANIRGVFERIYKRKNETSFPRALPAMKIDLAEYWRNIDGLDSLEDIEYPHKNVIDGEVNAYLESEEEMEPYSGAAMLRVVRAYKKTPMNSSEYKYFSKKILESDQSVQIWSVGKRIWEVSHQSGEVKLEKPGMSGGPGISRFKVQFSNDKSKLIRLEFASGEGQLHKWDLRTLEAVETRFKKYYKSTFANLPEDERILLNTMLAEFCARMYLDADSEDLRQKIKELVDHLDYIFGKLEFLKSLAQHYAEKYSGEKQEILEKLEVWRSVHTFPEIVEIFDGRLRSVEKRRNIGFVELKSRFTHKISARAFNYTKLKANSIIGKDNSFVLTAFKMTDGMFTSEIEPQDYKSTS